MQLNEIVTEVKQSEEWEAVRMSILSIGLERGEKIGLEKGLNQGKAQSILELLEESGPVTMKTRKMILDETVRSHLSCNPAIINNLIDDFGWSIQSRDIKDPDHPDWVHVTAKASLMGAAIFCTHHCKDCKVIGPDKLREKVIENLRAGLALYE